MISDQLSRRFWCKLLDRRVFLHRITVTDHSDNGPAGASFGIVIETGCSIQLSGVIANKDRKIQSVSGFHLKGVNRQGVQDGGLAAFGDIEGQVYGGNIETLEICL
ncbi:MAG: hypothetical protein IPK01_08415 [Acidobacteria bacterium]|nr:hypothetical protein [Acidobacteriota bacterium]